MAAKVAYSLKNRPTTAGLYYVVVPLASRISLLEFQSKEGQIQLPDDANVKAGMLVWDDAGKERALSYDAAKGHLENGTAIPGVKWVNKVAAIGTNGVVDSYGYYLYLENDPPTLPGLTDALETDFDAQGNLISETDSYGRRITGTELDSYAQGLGDWQWYHYAGVGLVGAAALAGGWGLVALYGAAKISFGVLVLLGLVLATSSTAAIHYVKVSGDKNKSKGFIEQAKAAAKAAVEGISTAAKWTVGILGLLIVKQLLDVVD